MVKTAKIIATLGIAAGLGVTLLPVASHAETDVKKATEIIEVTIEPAIELTVSNNIETVTPQTGKSKITLGRGETSTSKAATNIEHTVNVNGNYNKSYSLQMYANGANLVGANRAANIIPSITGSGSLPTAGTISAHTAETPTHGWGYRSTAEKATAAVNGAWGSYEDTWNAIPVETNKAALHSASSSVVPTGFNDTYYVNFGIVTATDEVADTYSQTINYEATGASYVAES